MERVRVQKDDTIGKSPNGKSPSKMIGGWAVSEGTIKEEAYKLWASGHSPDSDTNWFEAERRISDSLSN